MGYFFYLLIFLPLRPLFDWIVTIIGRFIPLVKTIVNKLDQISTIFHEWCHFLMLKVTFVPVSIKDISYSHNYHSGSVSILINSNTIPRLSFMKMVLMALAQLMVGTWGILKITSYWSLTNLWGKVGIAVVVIILILGFQPSHADYRCIYTCGIRPRPWVALRQLIFLGISFMTYIVFADSLNRWHAWIPILYEIVMILGIFWLYDMACILLYDGIVFIFHQFSYSSRSRIFKRSKHKVPYFPKPIHEDPVETYIVREGSI